MQAAQQSPRHSRVLEKKIAELRAKSYLPSALAEVVGRVALLQSSAEKKARFGGKASLPRELTASLPAADIHAQGACLLERRRFPVDMALAAELAPAVLGIIAESAAELAPVAEELAKGLAGKKYSLEEAVLAVLEDTGGANTHFAAWENAHHEAPRFFRFVAQSVVMPSAAAAARLLAPRHNPESVWPHGHCPLCGSLPLMGRLKDAEGKRMHSCSFCGFEYRVPRIGCAFCLHAAPENSEYYASEEEPGYQIDVCQKCKNYIKLADFRELDRVWVPMLDDLASLTLDISARQMGYGRPTLSAWGF